VTELLRITGATTARVEDAVAVEEPLEVRLHGFSFAVLMRTPGDDEDLAAGFLFSERVIESAAEIDRIEPCHDAAHPHARNIVNVTLRGDAVGRLARLLEERRCIVTNSSCGVCGRLSIESLQVHAPYVDSTIAVSRDAILSLPGTLRARQSIFSATGGLHAAALFASDGVCVSAFEDVGRHNAVDKLVGCCLRDGVLPASDCVLMVSGRASFELVQKAFLAGIPLLAAVSAPSTLAIQLADAAGITLVGFVRENSFNVYTHPKRICASP
jgi:FdhD protein